MRVAKTEKGIQVLKDRSIALTVRQRGALILCRPNQTKEQVVANASQVGITETDFQCLVDLGLIKELREEPDLKAQQAAVQRASRTPVERYKEGYPVAVKLAGSLGLRGFRLSLAIEKSQTYEDLCKVAPDLKKAVARDAYRPLEAALFG